MTTALAIAFLLILLLTPVILMIIGSFGHPDWGRLSNISQSYDLVGVALSSVALLAVALSLLAQREEIQIAKLEAIRNRHDEVYGMALGDVDLLACLKGEKWAHLSDREFRQMNYVNMVVNYWLMGYRIGGFDEATIRGLASETLTSEPGRLFADTMLLHWVSTGDVRSLESQFVEILRSEYDAISSRVPE